MVRFRTFPWPLLVLACAFLLPTGCDNQSKAVRQIQAQRHELVQQQSKHDHLGEVFELLSGIVELNPEQARRQIAYHLNRWRESRDDAMVAAPELLKTLGDLVPPDKLAERVEQELFVGSDVNHLRDAYLFQQIVKWTDSELCDDPLIDAWLTEQESTLGEDKALQLRTAARLFDWTVRNIAYETPIQLTPLQETPPLPAGLKFGGPGYRQSDYQTVWRGTGDALQRAGVFTQLCRQAEIPAFLLSVPSSETGELTPWCVGVLIGEEIYLFEPELGIFVPGPDQIGIATFKQARRDASVMRRLTAQGFFDYPFSKSDIQTCTAQLNLLPEGVSSRMKNLEESLTGERRMQVYTDVDELAKRIDDVSGIAGVRLWLVPLQAEVYRTALERAATRDPIFQFWYVSRWAIMDADMDMSRNLSLGRWRHLHGQFDNSDDEIVKGARPLYLGQRAPEFEIEKLTIDVNLQKQYGIRRELGADPRVYENQIRQVQGLMQLGKRTATYWLSLIQYDDGRYDVAQNWFVKRALHEEQQSLWFPAARYNLARTLERLGETDRAIELLKTDKEPQEHGNRIRARLIAKAAEK